MRATLFAHATAATRGGLRDKMARSHGDAFAGSTLARLMIVKAPKTNNVRKV